MKLVPLDKWTPCDGITLEDAADQAVRCDSNVLVVAGPGAGKTELLAQKAAFLLQTGQCKYPRKILAISFKTDAAQNLKDRVEKRCGAEARFRFTSLTYDAFAKRILDHFLYALPEQLRPRPDYLVNDESMVEAAFAKAGFDNPCGRTPTQLKRFYETTLSKTSLYDLSSGLGAQVWELLIKGVDDNKSMLTFKMISMLANYILQTNPKIVRALQLAYSHVFLDEFQDTTDIQYDLVKNCFYKSKSKMTAVGDHKQRIMLWAGAKKDVFDTYKCDFGEKELRMIMNHRSAPRLVNLQKAMYAVLKEQNAETIPAREWDPNDGNIYLLISGQEWQEALEVAERISKDISTGIDPKDICILCKQRLQDYSTTIIEELEKIGIRARIETEYQDLIKEPIIDLILKILSCAYNRRQPQKWEYIESTIIEMCLGEMSLSAASYNQVQSKLYQAAKEIEKLMKSKDGSNNLPHIIKIIEDLLDVDKVKAYFPAYRQGKYLNELLSKFWQLLGREFLYADGDWELAIENFIGLHSIPIMTIHKSKGLEYSSVYFIGLEDSAFWSFKNQPDEDRCAFFVALSRAKKNVTFTFCRYRSNLKYPYQAHSNINEFFDLLQQPGVAEVAEIT